jgi:hypothetical protein
MIMIGSTFPTGCSDRRQPRSRVVLSNARVAIVLNPVGPVRVRRILNVESGLNDGLTTPVVLFAIAATAGVGRRMPSCLGDRGKDSPTIKGNERPGVDLHRDQERDFIGGFGTGDSWQVADSDS